MVAWAKCTKIKVLRLLVLLLTIPQTSYLALDSGFLALESFLTTKGAKALTAKSLENL